MRKPYLSATMRHFALLLLLSLSAPLLTAQKHHGYTETIPGTELQIVMAPIPAGTFAMGSMPEEAGHRPEEAPVRSLEVDAFWMSETEITWELYQQYLNRPRGPAAASGETPEADARSGETVKIETDAVSGATLPYVDMSLGMGKGPGLPVGNVTRKAAARFCQWLSAQTGHFYRLPTEAEWEYAARAGSSGPYFFGSDPDSLGAYAWYAENSGGRYQEVGQKKPNPWGLYDMLGNVAEWTLDGYDPAGYDPAMGAYSPAQSEYPGVLRGGSFKFPAEALRSAARLPSDPVWKQRDPQFPRSKWWFTDAPFAGFRIVRPLHPPPPEDYAKYWDVP